MKEFDWLMLVPMGFMGTWMVIMICVIINGIRNE